MGARRAVEALRPALLDDTRSRVYLYVWLPMLVVQLVLYTRVAVRFFSNPLYVKVPSPDNALLHENHIGNLISLRSQPVPWMVAIHVIMAWSWIAVVIAQKGLVRRMAAAAEAEKTAAFAKVRAVHAVLGTYMVVIGLLGVVVAPVIAVMHHGNPGMKWFLVGQPLFFVPAIVMTLVTARDAGRSIWHHRFWADVAFLGPAVASVWTEAGIYVLGRMTPLGPDRGELLSSVVGGGLGALAVVVPGLLARRRGLAAEAGREAKAAAVDHGGRVISTSSFGPVTRP